MSMKKELVTVIIPTFKRSKVIGRALDSVFAQTYKNIEVIVVDDNANEPDERRETEKIVIKYPDVVFVKNRKNLGGALTRNVGIELAHGDYIAFLDDDDVFMPTKIEKQLEMYHSKANDNPGIIVCNHPRVDFSKKLIYQNMKKIIASTSAWFTTKKVLEDVGKFEDTPSEQDTILLLKVLAAGYNIFIVNEELTVFNPHEMSDGISGLKEKNIKGFKNLIKWSRKYYRFLDEREIKDVEYYFNRKLVSMHAYNCNRREAFKCLFRMIRIKKISLVNIKSLTKIIFCNVYSKVQNRKISKRVKLEG